MSKHAAAAGAEVDRPGLDRSPLDEVTSGARFPPPVFWACLKGNCKVAQLLLRLGADPHRTISGIALEQSYDCLGENVEDAPPTVSMNLLLASSGGVFT